MNFMIGSHEAVFMLAALGVVAFYIYIFVEKTNKKALLVSVGILVFATLVKDITAFIVWIGLLYGVTFTPFFQGRSALRFSFVSRSGIGGFLEEFFRSVSVVLYAKIRRKYAVKKNAVKKTKSDYSHIKVLDNQVFGLAFLFGMFESARMINDVFPNLNGVFISRGWNFEALSASKIFSIHPAYIAILAVGLVLRYYVHLRFLQFSIYALAAKRKMLYVLALLVHMSTGLFLSYVSTQELHIVIVKMTVIEIIVFVALTLLLKKLNLRAQIIANS